MDQVSVIIPACNCEKTIGKTIEGVLAQKTERIPQIIVVDDGSTDRTGEVVKRFPQVSYHYQKNAGPAKARNEGAALAQGNLIIFLDADCIPQPDWLEQLVRSIGEPNIAAVCGSYGIANPESLLARCIFAEISFRHQRMEINSETKVFGSYNVCIKKGILERLGKFNTQYATASGEDNDLSYRITKAGYGIRFNTKALVDHFHPTNLWKYLRTQFIHGYWRAQIYRTHPDMMRGDGYTFWKDILEPGWVLLVLFFAVLGLMGEAPFLRVGGILSLALFGLEFAFGLMMMKSFGPGFFIGTVMFLRSFFRTGGFVAGIFWQAGQGARIL